MEEMVPSHKGRSPCHYFSPKSCTTSPGSVGEQFFGLYKQASAAPLSELQSSPLLIRVVQTGGEGGEKGPSQSLASRDFLFPPTPSNLEDASEIPAISGPAGKVC